MKEIFAATNNQGKLFEIREILASGSMPARVISPQDLGLKESPRETGGSFRENARAKARHYSKYFPGMILAEDSGLEVDALNGAPGIYSARYASLNATSAENIARLLREMRGVENRRARFRACFVLTLGDKVLEEFFGEVAGVITERGIGESGFGYDPVFFYPPLNQTFAQMSLPEKNAVSHRRKALEKVIDFLAKEDSWI